MMSIALRPFIIRAHRWIGVALAPVFLLIILSGAVLSFRPIVAGLAPQAQATASVDAGALVALLGRLEAIGPVGAITIADGGQSVKVASNVNGVAGAWDIQSSALEEASSPSIDVFGIAERLHRSLLVGLGFVVQAATWAMLAAVVTGPFLGALRWRRSLMGWHKIIGWCLFPIVVILPLTAVLMTLGVGRSGAPFPVAARPVTISQALAVAAPQVDLTHLTAARLFRGGTVFLNVGGPNGARFVVNESRAVKLAGGPGLVQRIHEGAWAGAWSGLLNFVISIVLLGLTMTGFWSWARRARQDRSVDGVADADILVAHASQTGTAARFAAATAQALERGG
jgi:sulfite reductase (NADPH) flavoprotein alpha-component